MAGDVVLVEVADRIATITLNRPESRNALSPALLTALPEAVGDCCERDDVDVIVLTGADPAFCAGLDLRYLGAGVDGESIALGSVVGEPFPVHTKPIIGAVNGAAVTGGLEVALACDYLVASERARFADTHARVGIMPGWGLTVRLAEAVGLRRAREMSTTGNFVDASTALAWGLVNHVVAHEELMPVARALAADVASNDALSVRELVDIYQREEALVFEDSRVLEANRMRAWVKAGNASPEAVESRRRDVVERGRAQQERGPS